MERFWMGMVGDIVVVVFNQIQHTKMVADQRPHRVLVVGTVQRVLVRKMVGRRCYMPVVGFTVLVGPGPQQHFHNDIISFVGRNVQGGVVIPIQLIDGNVGLLQQPLDDRDVVVGRCPVQCGVAPIVTHVDVVLVVEHYFLTQFEISLFCCLP